MMKSILVKNDSAGPMVGEIMMIAFVKWAKADPKYKKLFKKLQEPAVEMVGIILNELGTFKPGEVWTWWAYPKNHMRFNDIKQIQKNIAQELLYNFLSKYSRGELNSDGTRAKKQRRKALPGQG